MQSERDRVKQQMMNVKQALRDARAAFEAAKPGRGRRVAEEELNYWQGRAAYLEQVLFRGEGR